MLCSQPVVQPLRAGAQKEVSGGRRQEAGGRRQEDYHKFKAKTTSGDIEIEKIDGNVELTSTSGDIESSDFKITQKSTIKSTSGNVRMNINSESNCEIRAKSTSGNIDFPNGRNVMGQEPYIELNVQTTSGNIELK